MSIKHSVTRDNFESIVEKFEMNLNSDRFYEDLCILRTSDNYITNKNSLPRKFNRLEQTL